MIEEILLLPHTCTQAVAKLMMRESCLSKIEKANEIALLSGGNTQSIKCFNCEKTDHFASRCKQMKQHQIPGKEMRAFL